jgi:two-component system, OmpR family, sensor histidine kinase VicK
MGSALNVLIVEDSEYDAALLVRELRRGGFDLSYERVDNEPAMTAAIMQRVWDIVLADYSMPHFNARAALAVMANVNLDTPCIVVSGSVGEETAVEVMRAGAQDLVLKHNLDRLLPAISRELAAARTRRERRAADAKLDRERQLLRQLMEGIPDAICFKDLRRRYTRLNDAERLILRLGSETDAIGKTADDLVAPELASVRRAEEERVLATGEPLLDCVEKMAGPNGTTRWLSATKAPIRSSQGDIIGLVEIARDITENKRQEQLKDEFIATVSHELRTPLTSIMASVAYLASGAAGDLPDSAGRMLKIADGNCRRLVRIVNDILDVDKIETGNMTYDRKPVQVRTLVDQVIQANHGFAADYRVGIRLDPAAADGFVLADPDRLIQVITNLLSNAVKFSPRDEEVMVGIERHGGWIDISIRDHGPGIPDDYKDRIFDKFVQVDATDQRQKNGTGLGLSIAKQIVAQLDGRIGFASAPGGGTIFTVGFRQLADESESARMNDPAARAHHVEALAPSDA